MTAVLKVATYIISSIAARKSCDNVMYVKIFKTGVIIYISRLEQWHTSNGKCPIC
jgi:hypothetical protein